MKKGILFIALGLFAYTMLSCDPVNGNGNGEDDPEAPKNYWERSALTHAQLRRPVKMVKEFYSDTTYKMTTFDEIGRILKIENTGQGNDFLTNYTYNTSGQLIQAGTTTFEYADHGKYVPRGHFHMNFAGLAPNLSAINDERARTSYTFVGDTLFIITTVQYSDNADENTYVDTTKILYSGKYPVSSRTEHIFSEGNSWGEFMNASYQENGMFDVYSEGFFGTGDNAYTSTRTYTYKKDDEFMLIDNYRYEDVYPGQEQPSSYTSNYTYNTQKDLTQIAEGEYIQEYSDYVYDTHNNWTSRKYRYKNGPEWSSYTDERREITYWE